MRSRYSKSGDHRAVKMDRQCQRKRHRKALQRKPRLFIRQFLLRYLKKPDQEINGRDHKNHTKFLRQSRIKS